MAQLTYPGVYIEEFTPASPIEGVPTSNAAFLGPCAEGPINRPTKVTSWDQFQREFGGPLAGFYLWYAARGFFSNGGKVCYVTRVSNASFGEYLLLDVAEENTVRVSARMPGPDSSKIKLTVQHVSMVTGVKLSRPTGKVVSASGSSIVVDDAGEAAQFRPGDRLTWNGSTETLPASVARVEDKTIRLQSALASTYTIGATKPTLRLADLKAGDKAFRADDAQKLAAGCVIKLTQGTGASQVDDDGRMVKSVAAERLPSGQVTYRVELRQGLAKDFSMTRDTRIESAEFTLGVYLDAALKATYAELGMDADHPHYYARVIGDSANGLILAAPVDPPNVTLPPNNRPKEVTAQALSAGTVDDPATLSGADYKKALGLLEAIDDISLVAVPDRTDADVQTAVIGHCKKDGLWDRFAILDSRPRAPLFGQDSVEEQRNGVIDEAGFAALYYPWLKVSNAAGNGTLLVPPSGHVAGIYARTDAKRGVHKAPAGIEAQVEDALGAEFMLSDVDQGELNIQGVNVIRVFAAGGRPIVWGARTTAKDDKNWRYVNIRRLFLYLEESIQEGIRSSVFEPNIPPLWQKLKRTITAFLTQQWRDGALFGNKAEEAFFVRIDDVLNPDSQRALGRLNIEIGVRPAYPAEFIVVRIGIWQGGAEVSEG